MASKISSPTVKNLVGVSFVLESLLPADPNSALQLFLPKGFVPEKNCGIDAYALSYDHSSFADSPTAFADDKVYASLPSGTTCRHGYSEEDDLHFIVLRPDGVIEYGLDYAFQFGLFNAARIDPEGNTWRFQTLKNGVVLHLSRDVESILELSRDVERAP